MQSQPQCLWQANSLCGTSAVQPVPSSHRKAFQEAWSFVNNKKHEEETARRQQQLSSRTEECIRLRQLGNKGRFVGPHVVEQRSSEDSHSSIMGEEKMPVDKLNDPELPSWGVLCAIDEQIEIDDEFGLRVATPRDDTKALDTLMPWATAEWTRKPVRTHTPVRLQRPSPTWQTTAWSPRTSSWLGIDGSAQATHRKATVPNPAACGSSVSLVIDGAAQATHRKTTVPKPAACGTSVSVQPVPSLTTPVLRSSPIVPPVGALPRPELTARQHRWATQPPSALSTVAKLRGQRQAYSTMPKPICSASPPGQPQHGTMLQLLPLFRETSRANSRC